jgi:hypothetical protein
LTCFWGLNPDFDLKGRKLAIFGPCFGSCEAGFGGFGPIWLNMAKSRLKKWVWAILKLILTYQTGFGSGFGLKGGFGNLKIWKVRPILKMKMSRPKKAEIWRRKWKFIFKSTER